MPEYHPCDSCYCSCNCQDDCYFCDACSCDGCWILTEMSESFHDQDSFELVNRPMQDDSSFPKSGKFELKHNNLRSALAFQSSNCLSKVSKFENWCNTMVKSCQWCRCKSEVFVISAHFENFERIICPNLNQKHRLMIGWVLTPSAEHVFILSVSM